MSWSKGSSAQSGSVNKLLRLSSAPTLSSSGLDVPTVPPVANESLAGRTHLLDDTMASALCTTRASPVCSGDPVTMKTEPVFKLSKAAKHIKLFRKLGTGLLGTSKKVLGDRILSLTTSSSHGSGVNLEYPRDITEPHDEYDARYSTLIPRCMR